MVALSWLLWWWWWWLILLLMVVLMESSSTSSSDSFITNEPVCVGILRYHTTAPSPLPTPIYLPPNPLPSPPPHPRPPFVRCVLSKRRSIARTCPTSPTSSRLRWCSSSSSTSRAGGSTCRCVPSLFSFSKNGGLICFLSLFFWSFFLLFRLCSP